MSLPMTVLLDVAMRLGAFVVVMPGADDAPLLEAATRAGIAVVDAAVVRENLALLSDAGCAAAETRCLARLADPNVAHRCGAGGAAGFVRTAGFAKP